MTGEPTLRDVLEDALVQVENLSTPEDANYVLARIRAHCETPAGRLEVAGLVGHPTAKTVSTVEYAGGQRSALLLEGAFSEGEVMIVIVQRRWER